jgi:hypothetical protein
MFTDHLSNIFWCRLAISLAATKSRVCLARWLLFSPPQSPFPLLPGLCRALPACHHCVRSRGSTATTPPTPSGSLGHSLTGESGDRHASCMRRLVLFRSLAKAHDGPLLRVRVSLAAAIVRMVCHLSLPSRRTQPHGGSTGAGGSHPRVLSEPGTH